MSRLLIFCIVKLMTIDPSSMRADARRNYNRLIQAAEAIFSIQGTFTPLEAIAKRAGVGIGTLYRHFPTRKVLLEAVYSNEITDLTTRAHSLLVAKSPDKALSNWLQMTIEYATKYGGFSDLMSLIVEDKDSVLVLAGSSLLKRAQKNGTLRDDVTIFDLLHLINGIVANDNPASDLQRMNRLLSVIMAGLKPTAA